MSALKNRRNDTPLCPDTAGNQDGFVMVTCILLLAILTIVGVATVRTANTEVQIVRNEGQLIRELYDAEAGLIDALENSTAWLTTDFLTQSPTQAGTTYDSTATDPGDLPVAAIETRCIETSGTTVAGLSGTANALPLQNHIAGPPKGSGYSMKYFEIRRFGITATSSDGNTQLQVGTWKVFNKF